MIFKVQAKQGDCVITPDGVGIVLQCVGTPRGAGAIVLLVASPDAGGLPPVYDLGDLEPGPPLPVFEVGQPVIVPGRWPGTVLAVEGETILVEYEPASHRIRRRARYPHWRLVVSTIVGAAPPH